jgi:hypothetical protein
MATNISGGQEQQEVFPDQGDWDMPNGEGFTAADRKSLNILENELKHVTGALLGLDVRMANLEESRISVRDLDETRREVEEVRQKKVDREQFADHEARLRSVEKRIWMWIGGTAALSVVVSLLARLVMR